MKRRNIFDTVNAICRSATVAAVLSGCATVGPDYTPPQDTAPVTWSAPLDADLRAAPSDADLLSGWWRTLNDPTLSELIERAALSNLDLELARARLREARARRGVSAADRFPTVDLSGNANSSRSDPDAGAAISTELYSVGFDARWELDIFGGKRRALEAADAQLQASEEDLRDVTVSLLAEVALNYVDARAFQTRIAIAEKNLALLQESYDIVRWRTDAGLTTELDVEQALFNLEQTRAALPLLRSGLVQSRNRLAALLGQPPGSLDQQLATPAPIPLAPRGVAVGVPADMLRRRPDVRRAERQLAAQTAQVGVATAARYPNFTLSGAIGLNASSPGNLVSAPTQLASVGANLAATIFDAGRLRQNVEIQNALQEQAFVSYQSTVLTALEDAENALTAFAQEQSRRESLVKAAAAAERAAELASNQYTSGLVDFQVVLIAQRSAISLEDQVAGSQAEIAANLIRVYKALGGGWVAPPVNTSSVESEQVP